MTAMTTTPTAANGWLIAAGFSGAKVCFYYFNGGSPWAVLEDSSIPDTNDGNWHHYAVTYNGQNLKNWIDGANILETQVFPSITFSSEDFNISRGFFNGGVKFWEGVIDEVRLSSVVRYSGNFTPQTSFVIDGDTNAYYKFEEGSGATVADETINNHNLTTSGDPTWVSGV